MNDYRLCIPPWVGEKVFNIPEADRTPSAQCDVVWPEAYYQDQASVNYTRNQVREWFSLKSEIVDKLEQSTPNDSVLLNIRKGLDYASAGHARVGEKSYLKAANELGYENVSWETDTEPTRHPDFTGDIWSGGLGTTAVCIPSFYRLMKAPVLFRANSTFSWWAATLAQNQRVYSPVIKGLKGGESHDDVQFVEGNWPAVTDTGVNTDLYLP